LNTGGLGLAPTNQACGELPEAAMTAKYGRRTENTAYKIFSPSSLSVLC